MPPARRAARSVDPHDKLGNSLITWNSRRELGAWERVMPRQFTYRGHSVDELRSMSMDEFIKLLPSRQRRSLVKGLTNDQRTLMEHIRRAKKENGGKPAAVKTHCRDMIVIPEMLGLTLQLHSGKEYVPIDIKPEMVGHYIGEFAITNQKVVHGTPGIGASRSSMYVPLK